MEQINDKKLSIIRFITNLRSVNNLSDATCMIYLYKTKLRTIGIDYFRRLPRNFEIFTEINDRIEKMRIKICSTCYEDTTADYPLLDLQPIAQIAHKMRHLQYLKIDGIAHKSGDVEDIMGEIIKIPGLRSIELLNFINFQCSSELLKTIVNNHSIENCSLSQISQNEKIVCELLHNIEHKELFSVQTKEVTHNYIHFKYILLSYKNSKINLPFKTLIINYSSNEEDLGTESYYRKINLRRNITESIISRLSGLREQIKYVKTMKIELCNSKQTDWIIFNYTQQLEKIIWKFNISQLPVEYFPNFRTTLKVFSCSFDIFPKKLLDGLNQVIKFPQLCKLSLGIRLGRVETEELAVQEFLRNLYEHLFNSEARLDKLEIEYHCYGDKSSLSQSHKILCNHLLTSSNIQSLKINCQDMRSTEELLHSLFSSLSNPNPKILELKYFVRGRKSRLSATNSLQIENLDNYKMVGGNLEELYLVSSLEVLKRVDFAELLIHKNHLKVLVVYEWGTYWNNANEIANKLSNGIKEANSLQYLILYIFDDRVDISIVIPSLDAPNLKHIELGQFSTFYQIIFIFKSLMHHKNMQKLKLFGHITMSCFTEVILEELRLLCKRIRFKTSIRFGAGIDDPLVEIVHPKLISFNPIIRWKFMKMYFRSESTIQENLQKFKRKYRRFSFQTIH